MFEDRQYQIGDVNYAIDHGADLRPIHCSPTGSGKTVIQALVAKRELDRGNRTAILTPRAEIFGQTHGVLNDIVGARNVATLKAGEEWRGDKPVHIVSWPTLTKRTRKSDAWYPSVERLIVDEAHLSMAPRILECLDYYREQGTVIDGYTATPARKSGRGLGSFFTNIHHVTSVRKLIADGKLAPLEYWGGKLADLTGVRTTAGDYNSKDLAKASAPLVGDVIDNWLRLASERHTLVFAVDVAHCEALTDRFRQAGIKAAALHVHKPTETRAEIVRQFKARQIQVLVNVTIASYGFDAPSVDCIVLARPTKSVVLWLQMLGRGMRTHDGKAFCMVIDHTNGVRNPELGYADDLRRWRLDKGRKASANWTRDERNKERQEGEDKVYECVNSDCRHLFSRTRVCPKCGTEVPMPKRDIAATDAELVPLSRQREIRAREVKDQRTWYLMARGWCEMNGKKPGMAYYRFKAKYKTDPLKEWNRLPSIPPDVRVSAEMHKALVNFARRQSYAKRRKAG